MTSARTVTTGRRNVPGSARRVMQTSYGRDLARCGNRCSDVAGILAEQLLQLPGRQWAPGPPNPLRLGSCDPLGPEPLVERPSACDGRVVGVRQSHVGADNAEVSTTGLIRRRAARLSTPNSRTDRPARLAPTRGLATEVWTGGEFEVFFQYLGAKGPFVDEAMRLELRQRLNAMPEISIPADAIGRRPAFRLNALA